MEKTITLKEVKNLKKFEGWRINRVENGAEGVDPVIIMELSHPLSENKVCLKIKSTVAFGRSGNVFICNALMTFNADDVPIVEPQKE